MLILGVEAVCLKIKLTGNVISRWELTKLIQEIYENKDMIEDNKAVFKENL